MASTPAVAGLSVPPVEHIYDTPEPTYAAPPMTLKKKTPGRLTSVANETYDDISFQSASDTAGKQIIIFICDF